MVLGPESDSGHADGLASESSMVSGQYGGIETDVVNKAANDTTKIPSVVHSLPYSCIVCICYL